MLRCATVKRGRSPQSAVGRDGGSKFQSETRTLVVTRVPASTHPRRCSLRSGLAFQSSRCSTARSRPVVPRRRNGTDGRTTNKRETETTEQRCHACAFAGSLWSHTPFHMVMCRWHIERPLVTCYTCFNTTIWIFMRPGFRFTISLANKKTSGPCKRGP